MQIRQLPLLLFVVVASVTFTNAVDEVLIYPCSSVPGNGNRGVIARNLKNCDEKKFEAAGYRCYSPDARRVCSAPRERWCIPRGQPGSEDLAASHILEESKACTMLDRIEFEIVPTFVHSKNCLFSVQQRFFN